MQTCSPLLVRKPRLQILRALLAAHPDGMVVGEIQSQLGIAVSTLSHHLEKLKNEVDEKLFDPQGRFSSNSIPRPARGAASCWACNGPNSKPTA